MTFPGPPRLHMCHRCTSCVGSACASRVSAWEGRYQDGRQTESLWGPQTIALGVLSCNVSGEAQRVPPAVSVSAAGAGVTRTSAVGLLPCECLGPGIYSGH